jgi:succinate-semialdehyde dehydrogenase/glutarate-semialdehyde dehydrogenase
MGSAVAVGQAPVTGRLFIGGRWEEAREGRRFEVRDPASGALVGTMAEGDAGDARRAVDAAAAAFPAWAALAPAERARILVRAADRIRERLEEIAVLMTREQGKPLAEARAEVAQAADFFQWFAEEGRRAYGELVPPSTGAKRLAVIYQPVGVAAAITPWNFPASMVARKVAPALAAGCTVVCKPAPATPLTACALFRCLEEAGLPPGVANLVAGPAEPIGEVFLDDPRVRKISFTGSTRVGKYLAERAARQLKRVSLELGGHAPFLVFADADLERAVDGVIASKFRNAGQTCVCANRLYVEASVADEVERLLVERVRALRVGHGLEPGVQVGPLISDAAMERMAAQVADAVERGGRILCGGRPLEIPGYPAGRFFAPTVLADLDHGARLAREETFGPLLGVWRFRDEREAIALANDTTYGLAAYVFTRDLERAIRVTEALEYGIVGLNDVLPATVQAPFGGWKESGLGREGGHAGLREYLETKFVSIGLLGGR